MPPRAAPRIRARPKKITVTGGEILGRRRRRIPSAIETRGAGATYE
jgi:hypothetical protein